MLKMTRRVLIGVISTTLSLFLRIIVQSSYLFCLCCASPSLRPLPQAHPAGTIARDADAGAMRELGVSRHQRLQLALAFLCALGGAAALHPDMGVAHPGLLAAHVVDLARLDRRQRRRRKRYRRRARLNAAHEHRAALEHLVSVRSEEHTSELQSLRHLVCRLLLEKKK